MNDWQGTFNGLTFGAGTSYRVTAATGLHDTPDVRTSDVDQARGHGQFAGTDLLGGRSVQFEFTIIAPSMNSAIIQAFSHAMVTGNEESELVLLIPGLAESRTVQTNARVRRLAMPIDTDYRAGASRARVEWWCTDPRIYDVDLTTVSTAVADTAGTGEEWPWEWPIDWGGEVSGGAVTATNDGEFPTPWVATLTGPLTSPRITNATSDETIRIDGTLESGETLVIDSADRSILLNGTTQRYRWLRSQSQWFDLAPGDNTIRFAATAGTGSLQLEFRSAWI